MIRHCHFRSIHQLSELLRSIFTLGDSGRPITRTSRFERLIIEVDPLAFSRTAFFLASHPLYTVMLKPTAQALEALTLPRQIVARAVAQSLDYWVTYTQQSLDRIIANLLILSTDPHAPSVPFVITKTEHVQEVPLHQRIREGLCDSPASINEQQFTEKGAAALYMLSQCTNGKVMLNFSAEFVRDYINRHTCLRSASRACCACHQAASCAAGLPITVRPVVWTISPSCRK